MTEDTSGKNALATSGEPLTIWEVALFSETARRLIQAKYAQTSMLELVQSEIGRVENDNTEPTQNDEAKISTNWVGKGKAKAARFKAVRELISTVIHERGISTKSGDNSAYHKQGNLHMYSSENMRKREALKVHPDIERCIERMWIDLKKDREGNLSKEVYIDMLLILYGIMIPDGNVQQARATAETDWKHDSKGAKSLDYQSFYEAIFELADVWCESIEANEYSFFLLTVHKRVSDETNKTLNPIMKPFIFQSKEEKLKMEAKMSIEKRFKAIVDEKDITITNAEQSEEAKKSSVAFTAKKKSKSKHGEANGEDTENQAPMFGSIPRIHATVTPKDSDDYALPPSNFHHQEYMTERSEHNNFLDPAMVGDNQNRTLGRIGSFSSISSQSHFSSRSLPKRERATTSSTKGLGSTGGNLRDMSYFHKRNNAEHKSRVMTAKPKYMDKTLQSKPQGPMTLEKVILHQMRHSHSAVSGDYPKSYVHLSGFIEMGIVNTDDIYGQKRIRSPEVTYK